VKKKVEQAKKWSRNNSGKQQKPKPRIKKGICRSQSVHPERQQRQKETVYGKSFNTFAEELRQWKRAVICWQDR